MLSAIILHWGSTDVDLPGWGLLFALLIAMIVGARGS